MRIDVVMSQIIHVFELYFLNLENENVSEIGAPSFVEIYGYHPCTLYVNRQGQSRRNFPLLQRELLLSDILVWCLTVKRTFLSHL